MFGSGKFLPIQNLKTIVEKISGLRSHVQIENFGSVKFLPIQNLKTTVEKISAVRPHVLLVEKFGLVDFYRSKIWIGRNSTDLSTHRKIEELREGRNNQELSVCVKADKETEGEDRGICVLDRTVSKILMRWHQLNYKECDGLPGTRLAGAEAGCDSQACN